MTEINSTPEQVIEELDFVEVWTTDENGNPTKVRVY